jgi:predicted Rossmann-fold nucleotide-binding protein
LHQRLARLIELGDAYVVLPGSTGTLVELAMVWELINKGLIPRRPILCWGDFWRPVVDIFRKDTTVDRRTDPPKDVRRRGDLIDLVKSTEEAVAIIAQAFAGADSKI